jgi:hypothetical protein
MLIIDLLRGLRFLVMSANFVSPCQTLGKHDASWIVRGIEVLSLVGSN